jgi:hypothetical protein
MLQSLNLYLISDATGESLAAIAKVVRDQHAQVRTLEHPHPSVRSRRQLDRVLKEVEAAPGIVIYSLSNQQISEALEQSCKRLNVPCIAAPKPTSIEKTKPSRSLRAILMTLLALFLVWEVITRSLAAYWAEARPETAIHLPSTNPTALVNVAEAKLKASEGADDSVSDVKSREQSDQPGFDRKDFDRKDQEVAQGADPEANVGSSEPATTDTPSRSEIRSYLESALRKDPLNARAFRILGQIAASSSDEELTQRLMKASASRSLQESVAIYWMMRKSYEDRNYDAAIRYADVLLRTRPDIAQEVMPILGRIAEDESASGQLEQLLATNPPWRRGFFDRLPGNISDARTPLKMLLSLKDSPNPPSAPDLRSYLKLLVSKGFYDVAYYTWLQFLPAAQLGTLGLLFNGDFESTPSGLPFDWTFTKSSGVTIKVADRPDNEEGRALFLDFGGGRVEQLSVAQLVMLAPGEYRLQGKHNADIESPRGLQWRITCAGKQTAEIAESSPVLRGAAGAGWQDFSFSFTVPKDNCPAQLIQLVFNGRWASEQFISGSIWYDELQIAREPAATQ